METTISKLSNPDNVVSKKELTMCFTFKVVISHELTPILDLLYKKASKCVKEMLAHRDHSSSKYYKTIPCVLAKSLITKYQRNKKIKMVSKLVLPICGDKGKQVKIVKDGIRIPAIFKKIIIPITFPKPIVGYIRQIEFFKRNKKWFMSYSYNTPIIAQQIALSYLGVDRNAVGNVATIADSTTGKVMLLGCDVSKITENFRNRRKNLQKKGAKNALNQLKRKQSNKIKDINHKVSCTIVDYAKVHRSAIVLEDLGSISKKGKAKRYVQKSQWSFYQLEMFLRYKSALLGIPLHYINPRYTSRICSKCGSLNLPNGKQYKCSSCGHFDHRDANAAFNISAQADFLYRRTVVDRVAAVGHIGIPLNQRVEKAMQLESSGGAR
ncbi:MAG: transposase [Patescibacteria group bacterium]